MARDPSWATLCMYAHVTAEPRTSFNFMNKRCAGEPRVQSFMMLLNIRESASDVESFNFTLLCNNLVAMCGKGFKYYHYVTRMNLMLGA